MGVEFFGFFCVFWVCVGFWVFFGGFYVLFKYKHTWLDKCDGLPFCILCLKQTDRQ